MNQIVSAGGEFAAPAITWDPNSGAALPAYMTEALGELGSNIPDRNTVPSLSYEGKTWTVIRNGNKQKLQAPNSDGDMVPIPIMRVVILKLNADRGRAFYPGTYNPAASAAPTCWSADGKAPDASVKTKQAALCNGCPQSVKGSKIMEGREMVACSSHRLLAISPALALEEEPLRLKIAVTSDYDKEIVEHGWYALRQYVDWLQSKGITHTALVVTKIKFDMNVAFPKLLFSMDRPLSQLEVAQVKEVLKNPKVDTLLSENWTPAGANGTLADEADMKPYGLEGAYADGWVAHPDSGGYSYKGQEVITNEELAARYPAPPPPPVTSTAPPPLPGGAPAQPTAPVETPAPVAPAAAPPEAAPAGPTKPTDPAHIAHAGTEHEMWWINDVWVPLAQLQSGNVAAPVVEATPAATTASVATAAPEQSAPPTPTLSGLSAAEADGWVKHPDGDWHYKGDVVEASEKVAAMYPGNAPAAPATPAVPAAPAASSDGPAATTTASPTSSVVGSAEVPADVQGLLAKWTGGAPAA